MKTFWISILAVVIAVTSVAQTNAPANATPALAQTQIYSDWWEANVKDRTAIYRGNVRVEDPRLTMTCQLLTARMMTNSTRFQSIVAEHNVIIDGTDDKGEKAHATAQKLVYSYAIAEGATNEIIELSGKPQLTDATGRAITGDPIVWNITSGRITAPNHATRIPSGTNGIAPILDKLQPEKKP